jgi:hypothetical protein
VHRPQLRDEGAFGGVVNLRPNDVAGQQVRGALDPAEFCADGFGHCLRGGGLGESRDTFQQDVPAGQQAHQQRFAEPRLAHHLGVKAAGYIRHDLQCACQSRRFYSRGQAGLKHWISP